jgi:hypothetical protein
LGEKTVLDQDQGRWLTYAEAGQQLGISPEAVRQLARRRGWPRRTPNAYGIPTKVLVPDDAPVRPRPGVDAGQPPYERGTAEQQVTGLNRPDESSVRAFEAVDMIRIIRETMEGLVAPLREQLDRERARADRAETALADAIAAERIAAGAAAGLRTEADGRRAWSLLRRLRWALRGGA